MVTKPLWSPFNPHHCQNVVGREEWGEQSCLGREKGEKIFTRSVPHTRLKYEFMNLSGVTKAWKKSEGGGKKMKEGGKNPNFFLCNYNFHKQEYTKLQHWLIKESWGKCLTRSDTEIHVSYLITFVILEACPFLPILISSLNTFLYIGTRSLCMFELICVSHINVNIASGHLIQQHHTIKFPISKKQKRGCH